MRFSIVVEGEVSEKLVYAAWLPQLRPGITQVNTVFDLVPNSFSILAGGGYPSYFEVIDAAIEDACAAGTVDRLVIAVDSENMTSSGKRTEVLQHLGPRLNGSLDIRIVVQHFCIETWGLGNRRINPRKPKTQLLRQYRAIHDVRRLDPEDLPANPPHWNRAQFAERYLRAVCNDRYRKLTYTKGNPRVMLHKTFFKELQSRLTETGHIGSFQEFLNAFT